MAQTVPKETASSATPKLKALGCSDADIQKAGALPGINWAVLLQLIQAYGPTILTIILSLFGTTPAPSPLPPLPVLPTKP